MFQFFYLDLVSMKDHTNAVSAALRNKKMSKFEKVLRFYQAPFVKFFANVVRTLRSYFDLLHYIKSHVTRA